MKEATPLTPAQIRVLHTRGLIDRAVLHNALLSFHGDHGHVGQKGWTRVPDKERLR